jgi:AcrR family transcriptional regulator
MIDSLPEMSWAERAADRSPSVQRSRLRTIAQAQQIVAAARRLIAVKGEQFTTQELAKEAGVAVQTFYRYFPGKDQLLLAVIEDMLTESSEIYWDAAKGLPDPLSRIRYFVTAALTSVSGSEQAIATARFVTAQHWRLYQLFPEEMNHATQPFTDLVIAELRKAQAEGSVPDGVDIEAAAAQIARQVVATYHYYAFATTELSVDEIADQVWSFCLNGISGTTISSAVSDQTKTR